MKKVTKNALFSLLVLQFVVLLGFGTNTKTWAATNDSSLSTAGQLNKNSVEILNERAEIYDVNMNEYLASKQDKDFSSRSNTNASSEDSIEMKTFDTVAKTQAEAVEWLRAQNGNEYILAEAGGAQCTDFASAYMNWLVTGNPYGGAYSVYWPSEYIDIANSEPDRYWTEPNYEELVPSPGDIFISNGYGHIGVVIEAYGNSSALVAEQNAGEGSNVYTGKPTWVHTINWAYYGPNYFIHPIFASWTPSPDPTPTTVAVTGVSLDKTEVSILHDDEFTLQATINPSNATNQGLTWKYNENCFSLTDLGNNKMKFKCILDEGTVGAFDITVITKDGGKTATCRVWVKHSDATGISLNKSQLTITAGKKKVLKATIMPANASLTSAKWYSDNESVASVDGGNGSAGTEKNIYAHKAGTATITATTWDGDYSATCTVTVKEGGVFPQFTLDSLPNGDIGSSYSCTLTATGTTPMTWSIYEGTLPAGLCLYPSGVLSGTPTEAGTFKFTVTVTNSAGTAGKEYTLKIIDDGSAAPSLADNTFNLKATVGEYFTYDFNHTGKGVFKVYVSGDLPNGIAFDDCNTIEGTPTVTGTYNFTVRIENLYGSDERSFKITVKNASSSSEDYWLTLTPLSSSVDVGKTITLTASTNSPETIKWSSSDKNVATVKKGVVTGVSAGTVTITAKAGDLSKTAVVTVIKPSDEEGSRRRTLAVGNKVSFKIKKKPAVVVVSDPSIVNAKRKGKKIILTGKSAGSTTVTAYDRKGKTLGIWNITVQ